MRRRIIALLTLALATFCPKAQAAPPSAAGARVKATADSVPTAFFYGPKVPASLLNHYDRVVVEPDHMKKVPKPGSIHARLYAYVSLGEVNDSRAYRTRIPKSWIKQRNAGWGSNVIDTAHPGWPRFVVEQVLEPLYKKGFRGFFFDTLDSYQRLTADPAERKNHEAGLANIVRELKKRHSDVSILLNRGFELLPACGHQIDGIVVESMFQSWDASARRYTAVQKQQSDALIARVRDAKKKFHVPITVIDYVPPEKKKLREATAKRIARLGFSPWITIPSLDAVGLGPIEIIPRRILLLYRGNSEGYLGVHDASVLIAPVLEWHGYRVDYHDVRKPLPSEHSAGTYAGIVVFVPEGADRPVELRRWLLRQMNEGTRVAFLEGFGFDPDKAFVSRLGLALSRAPAQGDVKLTRVTDYVGYEIKPRAKRRERPPVRVVGKDVETKLRVEDEAKHAWDGVVIGPWGGAAFIPFVLREGLEGVRHFVLDPYKFLHDALALPQIPAPDVTTEAGRRIFTIHIDGDGFVSRAEFKGTPYTATVILNDILKKYRVPHTVSIVEGEVGPEGRYPEQTPALEPIAREIFALPHVEMASHTFSHPFQWELAESGRGDDPPHLEHLPIPGYRFDRERELKGSIRYINSLAPPGKQVKVLLWSGSCSPSYLSVKMTREIGVYNVNGGGGTRTFDEPSLTRGTSYGVPKGDDGTFQVFATVENENVYTNDWEGPFYGYKRAWETFALNDKPRRTTHITIYYHFYSGAKTASLVALKEVYDWAVKQESTPLYLSQYAAKVHNFQDVTLARRLGTDTWEIGGADALRTVRLERGWGWPDIEHGRGLAGVRDVDPQGMYVHLAPRGPHPVVMPRIESRPSVLHIAHANGRIESFVPEGRGAHLRIKGHMPLEIVVGGRSSGCRLEMAGRTAHATNVGSTARFRLNVTDTGDAKLVCN